MMVQMALLALVSGDSQGLPTNRSFAGCLALYGAAIAYGFAAKSKVIATTRSKLHSFLR